MAATKTRRLRGILEVSRLEHTPNEDIREVVNLPPIGEVGTAYNETRGEHRRARSHELGATRCQTTGTFTEDVETADQTGHERCGGGGKGRLLVCRDNGLL